MMPKRYILILIVVFSTVQIVRAQSDTPTDPLIRVLQAKGVLTEAEARAWEALQTETITPQRQ